MAAGTCSRLRTDKLICVEENGRKFSLINKQQCEVTQTRVDGCAIKKGKACDYSFEIHGKSNRIMYVELKGKNVAYACEQIMATIKFFESGHLSKKREAYIVSSKVRPQMRTNIQNHKILFFNEGVRLTVKNNEIEVKA